MALDVAVDEVEFLTPKSEQTEEPTPAKKNYTEKDFADIQSEDIPF